MKTVSEMARALLGRGLQWSRGREPGAPTVRGTTYFHAKAGRALVAVSEFKGRYSIEIDDVCGGFNDGPAAKLLFDEASSYCDAADQRAKDEKIKRANDAIAEFLSSQGV